MAAQEKFQIYMPVALRERIQEEQQRRVRLANAEVALAAVVRDLIEKGLAASGAA